MVLHLSTFHLEGGAGVAATRLHRALLNAGEKSSMLVSETRYPEPGIHALATDKWSSRKSFARFVGERLSFYPFEKDRSVRFAFSPARVGADISDHPLVRAADVIHMHWFNFGFLSMESINALASLKKPMVWTLHDMWALTGGCHYSRGCKNYETHCAYCPYLSSPDHYDIAFQQFEEKKSWYTNAGVTLVSPSKWLNQLVQNASLTRNIPVLHIPNCIDTEIFTPLYKTDIRAKLNLPTDKKLVLFSGANTKDPRKGLVFFKEAMQALMPEMPDLQVLIMGKSSAGSFFDFPLPVHYLGKLTDAAMIAEAYNAADLIVVPSLEDNLPNTIMEAMACGTPAVGFDTGGIPEMIDHQVNGFVSTQGSATSLAAGIRWVLENNATGGLSRQAREKVLENYSEKVVTEKYIQLYQSLISK